MVKLAKYDKALRRDVVVETSVPSEANQLRNQGFKEVHSGQKKLNPTVSKKQENK